MLHRERGCYVKKRNHNKRRSVKDIVKHTGILISIHLYFGKMVLQNRRTWTADGLSFVQIFLAVPYLKEETYRVYRRKDKKYFIQAID